MAQIDDLAAEPTVVVHVCLLLLREELQVNVVASLIMMGLPKRNVFHAREVKLDIELFPHHSTSQWMFHAKSLVEHHLLHLYNQTYNYR